MKECPTCRLCFEDSSNFCPNDQAMLVVTNSCGTTLDKRYILEQRLGKGGMGSVYRAKHVHLKSTHAVKIISPEVVRSDESLLARFTQEAVLVASIQHPNVVSVTDFGIETANTLYLVMEYIDGISLEDLLQRERVLSPAKTLEVLKAITLGVGAAHSQGIIHRDLKPLNVMLRRGVPLAQAVKVLDFGLAKIKSTEAFSSLVMAKTTNLLGSPHYMPPEQWDNENIDTRSDVYSIGVMLFRMLTGEVPFNGGTMPNIMFQHMQAPVPSFESVGTEPAPAIENVIAKALEKDQKDRFATVEELLSAFEFALPGSGQNYASSPNAATVSFRDESFRRHEPMSTQAWTATTGGRYNLPYLDSEGNEKLATYFNRPRPTGDERDDSLKREFIHAQSRFAAAQTKVSQAEKLAEEFNEAQRAAEEARLKFLKAQRKLEDDVRREVQAEMESKLAREREAREKAEAEARRLLKEAEARGEAEARANQLAKAALDAQQRAQEQRQLAENEARQRQFEEGTRKQAEQAAANLAKEAADAMRRYEEAKKQAEYEARCRQEAEEKRRKVEDEIRRIAQIETERRRQAEEEAKRKITDEAARLEREAHEAQKKANEARRLAETEAQKREKAELARLKAEEEAKRLAEEILAAQKRLEEAEEKARLESQRRAEEQAARIKAEESARSSSLANQQNLEAIQRELQSQLEEARSQARTEAELRSLEEAARKKAEKQALALSQEKLAWSGSGGGFSDVAGETMPSFDASASFTPLSDTSSGATSNTSRIVTSKPRRRMIFVSAAAGLLAVAGLAGLLVIPSILAPAADTADGKNAQVEQNEKVPEDKTLPKRIKDGMVLIKGGQFLMGRDDADPSDLRMYASQYPAHSVTVQDFYIDRTEVTNSEYAEYVKAKRTKQPSGWVNTDPPPGHGKLPVTNISYFEAQAFADWVSSEVGVPCRLPTEQEWEYVARSGSKAFIFPWGNDWVEERANFATGNLVEAGSTTDETAVGGVKDMMGNVLEWTSSTLEYYPNFPAGKKEDVSGKIAVRGVSFTKDGLRDLGKTSLLLTLRQGVSPERRFRILGFRLACEAV